ncbi:MAG: pitrilysin family protein [Desulforhopalus sp.]
MSCRRLPIWLILMTCLGAFSFIRPAIGAEIFDNVTKIRLDNGLNVILMENHISPVVTFQIWYHAGSRKDTWGKTGLAHVFEHMMFKGTKKYSGEDFTRLIQSQGGNFNAFTSYDFAGYFENMMADRIDIAMKLEADRMQYLVLRPEDFQTEVKVVMEERRMRVEDNPQAYLSEQTQAIAFQAQPYHWPIIGWMDDLKRLKIEDMQRHYDLYYRPTNGFIVVVGDFQTDDMIEKIRKLFGNIPSKEQPPLIKYHDPPQRGERRVNVHTYAELPYIMIGYHVPNLKNNPDDAYVLEVIASILSAGKSSRLYKNLILEEQLALSATAYNSLLSVDPDLFSLAAEPLPDVKPDRLEDALIYQLERLKTEPVPERQLQKAKNQLETSFIYSQDSAFYQGMLLARYEIATRWEDIRNYVPAIRKVNAEMIQRVARKYFVKENSTVGILYPKERSQEKGEEVTYNSGEWK